MTLQTQWAIQSLVDGEPTERIMEMPDEAAARAWVEGFPRAYRLVSRQISEWYPIVEDAAAQGKDSGESTRRVR